MKEKYPNCNWTLLEVRWCTRKQIKIIGRYLLSLLVMIEFKIECPFYVIMFSQ